MTKDNLKLIKCYSFDCKEMHWDANDEWLWRYEKEARALHTFACGENEAYIVSTHYIASGENDGVDSDHHTYLFVCLHPVLCEDAANEEKVKELDANGTDGYTCTFDADVDIRDEAAYTNSIMWRISVAIDGYKSDRKKKELEEQVKKGSISIQPNAVRVYKGDYKPDALTVLDFDSDVSLADVYSGYGFKDCSSVGVGTLSERSAQAFGIDRPLCYFYPIAGSFGRPSVSAYVREDGSRNISVYFSNFWDTGGSAVICAYVDEKPAPLTEVEVQKITDFLKDDEE